MTEKDAWGYVRLSQEGDASLEDQKKSIREYAKENGLNLLTTRNEGDKTSGFNKNRDEYQLIREKINNGEIDAIISRDRARMSRDFDDRLELLTELRSNGVEWHVVEERDRLYLEDVQRAGVECLHSMMDHVKKMVEIERSRKAMAEREERGCYQGTTPYGLQFHADGCHLEKDPQQWENIQTILDARQNGMSQSQIVNRPEIDCSVSTISKIESRGVEWYAEKLAEYGVEK